MKRNPFFNYLFIFTLSMFTAITAQENPVPNPGFETWANGQPNGWFGLYTSQSSASHSGSYAVRAAVDNDSFPAIIWTQNGFAVSQIYNCLMFYYRFQPVGNDRFRVNVGTWSNGQATGLGTSFLAAENNYTLFTLPITSTATVPDCCIVTFQIWGEEGSENKPNPGTTFHIDDLSLEFISDVSVQENTANLSTDFELKQNYPNPFNPSTTIEFSLPTGMAVRLSVYNLLGQEVAVLVNERRAAGGHSLHWKAEGLSGGVYFYQLTGEGIRDTKKLILMR